MQIIISWNIWHHYKTHVSVPSSILQSVSDAVVEMWVKLLSEIHPKYSGGIDCLSIHGKPCIVIMKSSVKVPLDSVRHL